MNINNFFINRILFILALLFFPTSAIIADTASTNYKIFADVFSAGGLATSTSNAYSLADTIGEAIILSASSTSGLSGYGIKAGFQELYPDQFLTFSLGGTIIEFGILNNIQTKTGSHTMTIDTNAVNGFTIAVSGNTLATTTDSVTAIGATAVASATNTKQFGINLVDNTTPDVGTNPSGTAPIGSAAGAYATANSFAYNSGDTVASSASDISQTVFTVSYIANITQSTQIGRYSTTLTYSATANY